LIAWPKPIPHRFDLFPLRRILTGGAPVTDFQLAAWTNRFSDTKILVAYGSTEAEPVGHIEANERMQTSAVGKGYCTGIPTNQIQALTIPITKGRVDLDQRTLNSITLAAGQIGELVVSGDHVCRDYFRNPSATQENKLIEPDGTLWHRMGDTGYFDDQGRFWLVGRVHSTIKRKQTWIHPQLVEQVAQSVLPKGTRVAAVGVPDALLGEKVAVLIERPEDFGPSGQANGLIECLNRTFAENQMPVDRILFTSTELPLDPRHHSKIDYAKTLEMLESGKFKTAANDS
jgi:acyl-CoA synthetase (AMP-forming)/AMP-acid ligase II